MRYRYDTEVSEVLTEPGEGRRPPLRVRRHRGPEREPSPDHRRRRRPCGGDDGNLVLPRPPIVAVANGQAEVWVRRETYDDLDRLEVTPACQA